MDQEKSRFYKAVTVFVWLLSLLSVGSFVFLINAVRATNVYPSKTMSVDGKAERYVAPDFARIWFTESQRATTAAAAQEVATKKINAVLEYLKSEGIESKDIKTNSYQIYPVYEYYYINDSGVRCYANYCPPPYYQKENIIAYKVEQSVEVKVRKIEDAGKIVAGLGTKGIQNISGISMEIEDYEKISEEIKNEAIKDARAKAKERAKSLGVRLGDVIGVNDGYGRGFGYDYAQGGDGMMVKAGLNTAESAPAPIAPVISGGENKIEVLVNVTFEIK